MPDATPSEYIDMRPAYVRRLDAERRAAQAELRALDDGISELVAYLHSRKFAPPHRYVNVDDVLLRIGEARSAGITARGEA